MAGSKKRIFARVFRIGAKCRPWVRVRFDRQATSSVLVVLGVRRDGQKVLLVVKNKGGESEAAWRSILDDLVARGLRTPEFLITDGAADRPVRLWAWRVGSPSGAVRTGIPVWLNASR